MKSRLSPSPGGTGPSSSPKPSSYCRFQGLSSGFSWSWTQIKGSQEPPHTLSDFAFPLENKSSLFCWLTQVAGLSKNDTVEREPEGLMLEGSNTQKSCSATSIQQSKGIFLSPNCKVENSRWRKRILYETWQWWLSGMSAAQMRHSQSLIYAYLIGRGAWVADLLCSPTASFFQRKKVGGGLLFKWNTPGSTSTHFVSLYNCYILIHRPPYCWNSSIGEMQNSLSLDPGLDHHWHLVHTGP